MRLAAALAMLVLTVSPALAQPAETEDPAATPGGPEMRLSLAAGLVRDLLDQYDLARLPPDPEIPPVPLNALPQWTLPVVEEAAHAVAAATWLRPDAMDPVLVAEAETAIVAVQDNVAWDRYATEEALRALAGTLAELSGAPQQAATPQRPDPESR